MKAKKKKRAITLIEMMVVILIIGIIGAALAVNMRGSLEKGKAFTTEQNMKRIEEVLNLAVLEDGKSVADVAFSWQDVVARSPLVNADKIKKDGWGQPFVVSARGEEFEITSEKYSAYLRAHRVNYNRR